MQLYNMQFRVCIWGISKYSGGARGLTLCCQAEERHFCCVLWFRCTGLCIWRLLNSLCPGDISSWLWTAMTPGQIADWSLWFSLQTWSSAAVWCQSQTKQGLKRSKRAVLLQCESELAVSEAGWTSCAASGCTSSAVPFCRPCLWGRTTSGPRGLSNLETRMTPQ